MLDISIFIFRRDIRLFDNKSLNDALSLSNKFLLQNK